MESQKQSDIPVMDMTAWIEHPLVGKFLKRGPKIPVIRLSGVIADTDGLCTFFAIRLSWKREPIPPRRIRAAPRRWVTRMKR